MNAIYFLTVSLGWTFSWFFSKKLSYYGYDILTIAFHRFLLVSLIVHIASFLFYGRYLIDSWKKVTKKKLLLKLILSAFFTSGLNTVLVIIASQYIPSGIVATVTAMSVIFSELLISIIKKRPVDNIVLFTGFLGFIGLFLMVLTLSHGVGDVGYRDLIIGILISIIHMIIYTIGSIFAGDIVATTKVNGIMLSGINAVIGSIIILSLIQLSGGYVSFSFGVENINYWLYMFYLVIIGTLLAASALFQLISKVGVVNAQYVSVVYPTGAMLVSSFNEGYKFTFISLFGLCLVILSLLIALLAKQNNKKTKL
jgi:drug/metabolite transporter (DMT)-like permease